MSCYEVLACGCSLSDFVVSKATHLRCSPGSAVHWVHWPVQLSGSQVWSLCLLLSVLPAPGSEGHIGHAGSQTA